MHIALVQCPPWGTLPPLGTAALKAYLAEHGHRATCIDLNIDYCRERRQDLLDDDGGSVYARPDPFASESYDEWVFDFDGEVQFRGSLRKRPLPIERWVDRVLDTDPDAVGITVQLTNLGVALQVGQEVKRRRPDLPLVFGGPHVTKAQKGLLALQTGIPDLVVEGEGEVTLVELLDRYQAGLPIDDVAGIGRLVDGTPRWNERRPLLKDVDALPFPDFGDVDWAQYPNPYEIPIMGSRGCVLNCAFCYETVYWKRYRTQSPQRIVAEFEHQIASHPLRAEVEAGFFRFDMSFADSLVNGHLAGLERTADLLIERDLGVRWNGQATVNTKMDDAYFQKLVASGCTGLSFGLESGSQAVLDAMGKRFDIDDAAAFFERAHRAGIKVIVNVMTGFPTETRADLANTLRFLRSVQPVIHMVNNVSPTGATPGSKLHRNPESFGMVPHYPELWDSAVNLDWTSSAAGSERQRIRRTQWLHFWMTVLRVPHQRIAPTGRLGRLRARLQPTPQSESSRWLKAREPEPEPEPSPEPEPLPPGHTVAWRPDAVLSDAAIEARIAAEQRRAEAEPLLLVAVDQVLQEAISVPSWAGPLRPDQLGGVSLADMQEQLVTWLGTTYTSVGTEDEDGVVDVVVELNTPIDTGLAGLRILLFPPQPGRAEHRIAIFPEAPGRADEAEVSIRTSSGTDA